MSDEEFYTASPTRIILNNIELQEPLPELIDEVEEGLECFLILIYIADIVPYLLLTVALFVTFPLLAPVAIIPILFLINQSLKRFQTTRSFKQYISTSFQQES